MIDTYDPMTQRKELLGPSVSSVFGFAGANSRDFATGARDNAESTCQFRAREILLDTFANELSI